jgi:NADP-dependent alcohol dehydrogenase
MALNGLIQKGVTSDWAVHMMGHELTAQFGIDHARTLAVIAPSITDIISRLKKKN